MDYYSQEAYAIPPRSLRLRMRRGSHVGRGQHSGRHQGVIKAAVSDAGVPDVKENSASAATPPPAA